MHRTRRQEGQLFSDEFLRSGATNGTQPAPTSVPAGHATWGPPQNTHWRFPSGEERAMATGPVWALAPPDAAEDPLHLHDEPVNDTDAASFLRRIAIAGISGVESWEAKCGKALDMCLKLHTVPAFDAQLMRTRCLVWTHGFLCPLLSLTLNQVEHDNEVVFIRQVHLLAARVAPLVNMSVHELLSKPGFRRGGFGASVADPVENLVVLTQFLQVAKDLPGEDGGTREKWETGHYLGQYDLYDLHTHFLEEHLNVEGNFDSRTNRPSARNPGPWARWAAMTPSVEPAARAAFTRPGNLSRANSLSLGGGGPQQIGPMGIPPTLGLIVGSVELVQALRTEMRGFEKTKYEWESSMIVGAMRHCYQETKHTCEALRMVGEDGLVALLDKRCPVHTQFVNLIVRFLNFTNRATGRRYGYERDIARLADAYRQQLFFLKNVSLNRSCETCQGTNAIPICYQRGTARFSTAPTPCSGSKSC